MRMIEMMLPMFNHFQFNKQFPRWMSDNHNNNNNKISQNITITRARVKSRTSSSFESGLLWLSVWRLPGAQPTFRTVLETLPCDSPPNK